MGFLPWQSAIFLSAPLISNNLMPFVDLMSSLDFTARCKAVNPFESTESISQFIATM